MATRIKSLHDMSEADFLASKGKGIPIKVPTEFWSQNGKQFDVNAFVSPGSAVRFNVLYKGIYNFEEAASDNGKKFKESIEKALPRCSCSWEEDVQASEESSEESDLHFECNCTSSIPSKFTKDTFKKINTEENTLASIMEDVAFKYEREDY